MEYNQNIGKQLDSYSELFDIYLERGRVPQEYEEEPLSRYMRSQVEGFRDKIKTRTSESCSGRTLSPSSGKFSPAYLRLRQATGGNWR